MNLQDPVGSYRILENTVESRAVARMRQTEALASVIILNMDIASVIIFFLATALESCIGFLLEP